MPGRGRPRLTPEVYEARLGAYCARYGVEATAEGVPPFPAGRRETSQHREWLSLYKAHGRLARRARGVCERCPEPAAPGSVFCEAHRKDPDALAPVPVSAGERRRLVKAQAGRCPVCGDAVGPADPVHPDDAGTPRAVLHDRCLRMARLAAGAGPEALDRLRAWLWPPRRAKPPRG